MVSFPHHCFHAWKNAGAGQDLRSPQTFSSVQISLNVFFQLAAPEDPVRQLFSAFGLVDPPMGYQLFGSLGKNTHLRLLL